MLQNKVVRASHERHLAGAQQSASAPMLPLISRPSGVEGDVLAASLTDNPYFTAGFGLLGVGAGLTLLRQSGQRLAHMVRQRYLCSLEIASRDPAYLWIMQWLTKNPLRSGNHFSVQTVRMPSINETASSRMASLLVPSPGVHFLRWQGHWIRVSRERERSTAGDLGGLPFETVKLTMLGRSHEGFQRLLAEARADAASLADGRLPLYTPFAHEWRPFGAPRRRRPLDSVVLAPGIAERLLSDIKEFLASGKWYGERGIPYRRGYLLYGPPGTGKSSVVQAIASELGYSICLLNLADGIITDDRLQYLLAALPERSVLLLEDVDAASPSNSHAVEQRARLTLSGLLNALDGVGASEERLVFMTTNHPERLDQALIRPGRIDLSLCIDLAGAEQAQRMFLRFYPGAVGEAEEFVRRLEARIGSRHSPASIQGHFIQNKESARAALDNIEQLLGSDPPSIASATA